MQPEACSACKKPISGRDINYTANGAMICQECLDKGMLGRSPVAPEYEFDATENEVVSTLAGPMKFVAVVSIVFGVLNGIIGLLAIGHIQGALTLAEGIALIAVGAWLGSAAGSFRDIVTTEGSDISLLMMALKKLRNVYTLQAWLMGIACVLLAVVVFLSIRH